MFRKVMLFLMFPAWALASVPVADHVIGQSNKAFSAAEITIKPGEKIVFKNDDSVVHNVFSSSKGFEFNLKTQAPGATSSIPFQHEGTAVVQCAIHPKMKMVVNVKK
jgi:plastocyanin